MTRTEKFKKKLSHDEFMSQFENKKDVILEFGAPTRKDTIEGIEIWTFNKGQQSNGLISANSQANVQSGMQNNISINQQVQLNSSVEIYDKYVEFQFIDEKVVGSRTHGVYYGNRGEAWGGYRQVGLLLDMICLGIFIVIDF